MGKEWENHKYINKVKTKSGNTRYVYDIVFNKVKELGNDVKDYATGNVNTEEGQKQRKKAEKEFIEDAKDLIEYGKIWLQYKFKI